jgi:hypothetical protein
VGNRLDPGNPPVTWRCSRGALLQSSRPRVPDLRGRLLKRQIQALAHDVAGGRLLAAPAIVWEDWLDRVRILYGYDDAAEFTAARKRQQAVR